MAFVQNQLVPIGGQSKPRKNATPGGAVTQVGPSLWSYAHATDNLAAIVTAGYFNSARALLSPGDAIIVSVAGAAVSIVTVNAVPAPGTNVTIQTADINSA